MRWIRKWFTGDSVVSAVKSPIITPQAEIDVPRYPPFMKGLPAIAPEKILGAQSEIVEQISVNVQVARDLYDKFYLGALLRFAAYAHLLPASQSHHHRGAGGLMRHSMEVALWSMQAGDRMLLDIGKTPAQRRNIEPRWQLMTFLAGLCHDAGKPATDIVVSNGDRTISWKPIKESLYDWAQSNKVASYFLDWRPGRAKQHIALSNLIAEKIIGVEALTWIEEGGTELIVWLMEALNGNPGASNPLYDLVLKADQSSVERDLKSMGVAMAGYEIGIPVERHLTDIMRRLIKEGIWRINEPGARVWIIDGGTYIVWPAGGEEIAKQVIEDGIPGFPRTSDGILDMLLERQIAFVKDAAAESGGDVFWKIAPDVLREKIPDIVLNCIKLRDEALISSIPLASIAGKVLNSERVENDVGSEDAKPSVESDDSESNVPSEESHSNHHGQVAQKGADEAAKDKNGADVGEKSQNESSAAIAAKVGASIGEKENKAARITVDAETGEITSVIISAPGGGTKSVKLEKPKPIGNGTNSVSMPSMVRLSKSGERSDEDSVSSRNGEEKHKTSLLPIATKGGEDGLEPGKKKRKSREIDLSEKPSIEFDGAVGVVLLALAEDIKSGGGKAWDVDAIIDDDSMVRLRWPHAFSGYGLTQKLILDECKARDWIWVDPDAPMVRLVDSVFQGQTCKALRLNLEPSYAFIYHAGLPSKKTASPKSPVSAVDEGVDVARAGNRKDESVKSSKASEAPKTNANDEKIAGDCVAAKDQADEKKELTPRGSGAETIVGRSPQEAVLESGASTKKKKRKKPKHRGAAAPLNSGVAEDVASDVSEKHQGGDKEKELQPGLEFDEKIDTAIAPDDGSKKPGKAIKGAAGGCSQELYKFIEGIALSGASNIKISEFEAAVRGAGLQLSRWDIVTQIKYIPWVKYESGKVTFSAIN